MSAGSQLSDSDLIDALRRDDRGAFEIIYRRYVDELYRHARRIILRGEDCEEILQDVFESLWRTRQTSDIKFLRAYLYKAVSFKVTDYLKKKAVHQRYVEHFKIFTLVYESGPNVDELEKMFEEGIKRLPGRLQQVVRLRLSENLSNDEIAKRLQLTHGTVDTYMHQAYERFREIFPTLGPIG